MLDETGIFDLISTSLLFWEMVTFAILLVLVIRYVYPPIRDQIQKRQAEIEGAIDEAQKSSEEAGMVIQASEQVLGRTVDHDEHERLVSQALDDLEAEVAGSSTGGDGRG